MLSVYSGFMENEIDEFTVKHYNECLKFLQIKVNFESISNLYGNPYATDSSKIVNSANPFNTNNTSRDTNSKKSNRPRLTLQVLESMGVG